MTVDDVLFESWQSGLQRSRWVSEDGRIVIQEAYRYGSTATCRVDDEFIMSKASGKPKQFRALRAAMGAGVKETGHGALCCHCRQRHGFKANGQCKHCGRAQR